MKQMAELLQRRHFSAKGRLGAPPHWYGRTQPCFAPVLDLTDFKRDLSELTDRLGHAQDCL
jgi:peptide chain release factor 2